MYPLPLTVHIAASCSMHDRPSYGSAVVVGIVCGSSQQPCSSRSRAERERVQWSRTELNTRSQQSTARSVGKGLAKKAFRHSQLPIALKAAQPKESEATTAAAASADV